MGIRSSIARILGLPTPDQLAESERLNESLAKTVREYAQMAVPPHFGSRFQPNKPQVASWTLDRTEYVQNYHNSVYVAVGAIARKVAMQDVKVFRRTIRKSGEILEPVSMRHPLVRLFDEVNPRDTAWDLWFYTVGWRLITGDSFWWKARNGLGSVNELWPLPSQWVWAIPSETEYISAYRVEGVFGKEVDIPADDIVHLREPSLDWSGNGRFYGTPPLAAAATSVDLENAMFTRLFHQFRNFAPPSVIFSSDESLTPAQVEQIYSQIIAQHSMAEHSGRPMITHSGLKPQMQAQTVKEMDYTTSLGVTLDQTLAIFGVPKAVVGLVHDSNRSNMTAALESFVRNTINPLLAHISQHLTQNIAKEFGDNLVVRLGPCSVDDKQDLLKSIEIGHRSGSLDPNEIRELLFEKGAFAHGGDRPLVSGSVVEATFGNDELEDEGDDRMGQQANPSREALNGGQIKQLMDAASQVARGELGEDAAKRILETSFPLVPEEEINAMVDAFKQSQPDQGEEEMGQGQMVEEEQPPGTPVGRNGQARRPNNTRFTQTAE